MDDLSELKISPANEDDVDFAWPLYRELIKNVLFEKSSDAPEWDEDRERSNFETQWSDTSNYAISLDGQLIGWISSTEDAHATTLENMFITPEFQDRGIGLMLFKQLAQKWRKEKRKIVVPVLMLSQHGKRLQELVAAEGFVALGDAAEVSKMESNW
ncbi:MAG: GNAT family N-acetyltransferase [Hyphomicrobiales bacterium]